jgi:hypothetical protein
MVFAQIDHWFDGENHAGMNFDAFIGPSVMKNIGCIMKQSAQSVTAEIAHHAATLLFCQFLNGCANRPHMIARLDGGNTGHQAVMGQVYEAFSSASWPSRNIHSAGIAVPAVQNKGDIDIQDVPFTQRFVSGKPMANNVVERNATGIGISTIVQGRRDAALRLSWCSRLLGSFDRHFCS